jgi:hypothetical protein
MPLNRGNDRMVLVLFTLKHMANMKTALEGSRKTARTKGQMHQALELYGIVNVESVFGGLYSADAPTGNKRRRR